MKIAIVNSDQRMQQVYFALSKEYETLLINEFTNFDRFCGADALVLPVKGVTSTGSLYANGKELVLPPSFWESFQDKPIFAGIPQDYLTQNFKQCKYYMQDEHLKQRNARYTAEGILFLMIDNTSRCIQEQSVDVIGYGVCGKELVAWLQALKIPVRVIRRSCTPQDGFLSVEEYRNEACSDIIINTSISQVIDRDLLCAWKKKPLIIDIATPDVIDYNTALQKGIRVIKAGNLPTMVAYESAGNAIADYIRGMLHGKG